MEQKFFLHRIKRDNGVFNKGIEVHDSLDAAILSFHAQMKLAYNAPEAPGVDFVSCMVTDGSGAVVRPYADTWIREAEAGNQFFMHYIRNEAGAYTKGIDICADYGEAQRLFHAQMEYGYGNTKHANMEFVSCQITDRSGAILMAETWNKPEPEPEPEPEE